MISAPLDNVRLVLNERRSSGESSKFRWSSVFRQALAPQWLTQCADGIVIVLMLSSHLHNSSSLSSRLGRIRGFGRWASRGWSLFALSATRDVLGFAGAESGAGPG